MGLIPPLFWTMLKKTANLVCNGTPIRGPLIPSFAALWAVWWTQPMCGATCNLLNRWLGFPSQLPILGLLHSILYNPVAASTSSLGLFKLLWLASSLPGPASCYAICPGFSNSNWRRTKNLEKLSLTYFTLPAGPAGAISSRSQGGPSAAGEGVV